MEKSKMAGYGAEVNAKDEVLENEIRTPGAGFEPAVEDNTDENGNEIKVVHPKLKMPTAPVKEKKVKAVKEPKEKKVRMASKKVGVNGEPRLARSLLLKNLSFDEKRNLVLKNLSEKLQIDVNLVSEDKFESGKVSIGGVDLFVKLQKIEKENPDRSLKFFVYPSDFHGKKVNPVARCYEKQGRVYISRFYDKIDKYLASKTV